MKKMTKNIFFLIYMYKYNRKWLLIHNFWISASETTPYYWGHFGLFYHFRVISAIFGILCICVLFVCYLVGICVWVVWLHLVGLQCSASISLVIETYVIYSVRGMLALGFVEFSRNVFSWFMLVQCEYFLYFLSSKNKNIKRCVRNISKIPKLTLRVKNRWV